QRGTARASCAAAVHLRALPGGARRVRELSRAGRALRKQRGQTLGPRLDPRFRPGQARARRLLVAARFRPRPAAGKTPAQLDLREERGTRTRGAPQHAPVAEAVGLGLAAVLAQADERVLAGHQDVIRIDGRGHAAATSTRASLKHAPSEMSAWCAGQSAETVWPRSLVASHAPLSVATTPRTTASLILSGRRISPRSFQTRTRIPSWRPRARASSGC